MENKNIKLSKSSISSEEKKAVMQVLDDEFLGMGKRVKDFEDKLSNFFGRPAVCVVNGTAALHLSLQASGIGYGDEVLVQSLTYLASIQAISATGAKPIFCDIDLDTITLNIDELENKITQRTKAIMPVHYAGSVGKLNQIYDFARKFNLIVIEDAAHSFGSEYQGKRVGAFGDIACFSFDGIKNITSGEGGCIVSDNLKFLDAVKDARLLGVKKDSDNRYIGRRSYEFDVSEQGWRYHMSDLMAAIGIVQLRRFNLFKLKRRKLVYHYIKLLKEISAVKLLNLEYEEIFMHIFPIVINTSFERDKLRSKLLEAGISTGIHYFPNHFLSLYKQNIKLKNTEKIYPRIITLPLHNDLNICDIDFIVKTLKGIIE